MIMVVEDFNFDAPKTKQMTEVLNSLKVADKKTLMVVPQSNKNVYLSARNLQGKKVVQAADLNTYDILNANHLVIAESSLAIMENILLKENKA